MCNGSCKLYILSLFPCICTECLLRIVSSNYFFPILWECCAIKMPMLRIYASLGMFSVAESNGGGVGRESWMCEDKNRPPKTEHQTSRSYNSDPGIDESRGGKKTLVVLYLQCVNTAVLPERPYSRYDHIFTISD